MLCKRGLYRHAVSVRLSVCVSVTFVHSVKTNKHIVRIFCTKRHGNIPTGTPLTKALNGCGVGRNRDSEPISGFTACCEPFHAGNTYVNDRKLLWCRPLAATTAGEVFSGVFMVRPPPPGLTVNFGIIFALLLQASFRNWAVNPCPKAAPKLIIVGTKMIYFLAGAQFHPPHPFSPLDAYGALPILTEILNEIHHWRQQPVRFSVAYSGGGVVYGRLHPLQRYSA